jgi:ribulose-5-phosphate 4-epimerase/fuculose-1-phosphate aldolase
VTTVICADGDWIEGQWDVTGAVFLDTELHRVRPDARVVIHGHLYFATVLAGLGLQSEITHQNSYIFDGDIGFIDESDGVIGTPDAGVRLAECIGTATGIILANQGAIVTGATIQEAGFLCDGFYAGRARVSCGRWHRS